MKFGDIFIAIAIIAIIIAIIIPMPKGLLDIMLAFNISLALLIMLIAMYTDEALSFSIFPSILLITTLLRLSLNITTTRFILLEGNAGSVIEAFGNFVIQGNPIVGFIIFLIIVIVQFLVITKGSERVAEVAARFTLDAMPGKQMAIDADLNSGLINEQEARMRRTKIQRESDFYGAMDGATKFVKGDAIAGIIITVLNICAGFAIGMLTGGLSLKESLAKFTLLTVGDGLVSQIPALLISTATGIVVTRAASDSNLGQDILKQLFGAESKVMFIIAGVLVTLGLLGLPTLPLFSLAVVFLFLGYKQYKKKSNEKINIEAEVEEAEVEEIRSPENVLGLLKVDELELEFGYAIIPLADSNQGGDLFDRAVMIRRQIALELGLVIPAIRLRDNIQLSPNEYAIKIKGVEISRNELYFDHYLAMDPGMATGEIEGIDTIEPAFGLKAKWIIESEREKAEVYGYTVVDPPSVIITHLTEVIKRHSCELLSRQDVQILLDNVKEEHPALIDELVPKILSVGEVQKVLSNLLKEQISIRDMVTILETLADYAPVTRDPDMLTEYARQKLSRYITSKYVDDNVLKVVTVDSELEGVIMQSITQSEAGTYLSLDPNTTQSLINSVAANIQSLTSMGMMPIILTAPIVRLYLKRLTEQISEDFVVLSYNEINSNVEVQSLGMVSIR
ncbi:flagellar biosynthesis protein FlhA [Clostridiaceae bacterium M8S5]|nr:flagellar biosynthesis protein FlhA [Clostridiaceae bacterium M8S5]